MEVVKEIFDYLLEHYNLYMVVMMGFIIAFTNTMLMFVKKPIKCLTRKISNEKLRKLANKSLIFLSFGISAICWFILNKISSYYFAFNEVNVLLTGAFATVIYALGDGIFNKSQAEEFVEIVKDITDDGQVEDSEKHAISDFWNKNK
jgi:hypothetical protein